jgi:hypothetical protein
MLNIKQSIETLEYGDAAPFAEEAPKELQAHGSK